MSFINCSHTEEARENISAKGKIAWCVRRGGHIERERIAKLHRFVYGNPEIAEKRRVRLKDHHDKRRGFAIPDELLSDYKTLIRNGYKAKEAGIALGLIKD